MMNITEELIEIGETLGQQAERLQIARKMLLKREPQGKIVEFTSLPKGELAKLMEELGLQ